MSALQRPVTFKKIIINRPKSFPQGNTRNSLTEQESGGRRYLLVTCVAEATLGIVLYAVELFNMS